MRAGVDGTGGTEDGRGRGGVNATASADAGGCAQAIMRDGYCFVDGRMMRAWLATQGSLDDWDAFAGSWNQLGPDQYLAARGRQRRRRYGVWTWRDREWVREAHQPHYQALAYNNLQGDIKRWFEPITDAVGTSGPMLAILRFVTALFGPLAPQVVRWHLEVHQFRIEAALDAPGEPTPEGVHRDGVDYVLVLMIDRHNIASGTTTIHAPDGTTLGSFTLTQPLDAALLDDLRVYHGVTPVLPLDPSKPAHRDVLVVTLRRGEESPSP
jgi:hypothetical protein